MIGVAKSFYELNFTLFYVVEYLSLPLGSFELRILQLKVPCNLEFYGHDSTQLLREGKGKKSGLLLVIKTE